MLAAALPALVASGASLALLGDGDRAIAESLLRPPRAASRGRVHATLAWDERAARRLYAAADCVLVPSRFEPCGLVQLTAQRYGALPIAHRTGGLVDTIRDGETGILFAPLTPEAIVAAADRARRSSSRSAATSGWCASSCGSTSPGRGPAALWEATLEGVARDARARI